MKTTITMKELLAILYTHLATKPKHFFDLKDHLEAALTIASLVDFKSYSIAIKTALNLSDHDEIPSVTQLVTQIKLHQIRAFANTFMENTSLIPTGQCHLISLIETNDMPTLCTMCEFLGNIEIEGRSIQARLGLSPSPESNVLALAQGTPQTIPQKILRIRGARYIAQTNDDPNMELAQILMLLYTLVRRVFILKSQLQSQQNTLKSWVQSLKGSDAVDSSQTPALSLPTYSLDTVSDLPRFAPGALQISDIVITRAMLPLKKRFELFLQTFNPSAILSESNSLLGSLFSLFQYINETATEREFLAVYGPKCYTVISEKQSSAPPKSVEKLSQLLEKTISSLASSVTAASLKDANIPSVIEVDTFQKTPPAISQYVAWIQQLNSLDFKHIKDSIQTIRAQISLLTSDQARHFRKTLIDFLHTKIQTSLQNESHRPVLDVIYPMTCLLLGCAGSAAAMKTFTHFHPYQTNPDKNMLSILQLIVEPSNHARILNTLKAHSERPDFMTPETLGIIAETVHATLNDKPSDTSSFAAIFTWALLNVADSPRSSEHYISREACKRRLSITLEACQLLTALLTDAVLMAAATPPAGSGINTYHLNYAECALFYSNQAQKKYLDLTQNSLSDTYLNQYKISMNSCNGCYVNAQIEMLHLIRCKPEKYQLYLPRFQALLYDLCCSLCASNYEHCDMSLMEILINPVIAPKDSSFLGTVANFFHGTPRPTPVLATQNQPMTPSLADAIRDAQTHLDVLSDRPPDLDITLTQFVANCLVDIKQKLDRAAAPTSTPTLRLS